MSNLTEGADFAHFLQLYRQYADSRAHGNSQPPPEPQLHQSQVRRPVSLHLSPTHHRPQPNRQPPFRNLADLSTLVRALDEVKKRQEEIYVIVSALQTTVHQTNKTLDESVATMTGTITRFEQIGRGVLQMAVQSSDSQPPNEASSQVHASNPSQPSQYVSQPPASSNLQRTYTGNNATQPPHAPHAYAPSASQAQETFAEPFMEYTGGGFDFLANDTS